MPASERAIFNSRERRRRSFLLNKKKAERPVCKPVVQLLLRWRHLLAKLGIKEIPANEINLTPYLLKK